MFGKSEEKKKREAAKRAEYNKNQEKLMHDTLSPHNVNPKSEIIEAFFTLTNSDYLKTALVAAPLLAFAVPVRGFTIGILSDSLLIVPEKPKKVKFESVRIFWNDLDKYKLKITEFPKHMLNREPYIIIKWVSNGKRFTSDPIYYLNKIKEDVYKDFKKAAKIK